MYRCPSCNSDKIETKVINEIGYLYCNKCGFRTQVNDQDGGGQTTTTSPGIEFVVPPGTTAQDTELYQTLNEIKVVNASGTEIASYSVGVNPGDFAKWEAE